MKLFLIVILCVFGLSANSQYVRPNSQYGQRYYRHGFDSTLFYPTGCGNPSLRSVDLRQSALFYDSCGGRVWIYNPATYSWETLSGSSASDTTIYQVVLDSTGQPYRRVIVAGPNNKLTGYSDFIYDETTSNLRVQRPIGNSVYDPSFISDGAIHTNTLKTFVESEFFNSIKMPDVGSTPFYKTYDTTAHKPVGIDVDGNIRQLGYWPGSGGGGSGSQTWVTTTAPLTTDSSTAGKYIIGMTDPLPVVNGGTGSVSISPYGVVVGGATSTGPIQNAGTGSAGQLLYSNGPSALPTWVTPTYILPSDTAAMNANNIRRIVAGTNVTVDNTNPQYPIVSASGSGSSAKAYAPLEVRNDSVYQRFNVLTYGADNTGVSDATAAIQAAINAADAAGGGVVFFPTGTYKIAGARNVTTNSQLYIPYRAYTDTLRSKITLLGEGTSLTPNGGGLLGGAATPAIKSGSVLYSTITSGVNGFAVIGTSGTPNAQTLEVLNLGIKIKNNPSGTGPVIGGISWKNGANIVINNVTVAIDTSGYRSVAPQLDITGIECPDNGYGELYSISNTQVAGMRSGYKMGEHVLLSNANAMACYYAFYFKAGYHTSASVRVGSYWCAYNIYVAGFCTFAGFQIDVEWQQIGKWYDDVATIKDSANLARGNVFYTIIEAVTGKNNSRFAKSGGTGLYCLSNDQQIGSLIGGIQSKTEVFSGFTGLSTATLEISKATATATDNNFATLNLTTNQTGTNNAIGSVYFSNSSLAAVEKRIAFYAAQTDGATNSGKIVFGTANAGTLGEGMRLTKEGRLGIGATGPTAVLHLKAGTATASTAPIKLTAGTVLTTPEAGVIETNSNNELYYSTSTTTASRGFVQLGRYATTATSLTANTTHNTIEVTATGQTITLPTAVGIQGRIYTVVYTGASGSATVATTSSQTFVNITSAPTTLTLATPAAGAITSYTFQSNNANWLVISKVKNE